MATVISVKTSAAMTPMKLMTKSANLDLTKSAGQFLFCAVVCVIRLSITKWYKCFSVYTVPAKAHVANLTVNSKAPQTNAERRQNVLSKDGATASLLCVRPPHQRKTTPPAIPKLKFASMGCAHIYFPLNVKCKCVTSLLVCKLGFPIFF